MLNSLYLFLPIILQILIVGFDEVYYHNRRELSRREQIGHALDTLTVWVCFALMMLAPPTTGSLSVYVGLSIFSCLFITKDEFELHKACPAGERWLHGMAYLLHPLLFICAGLLWPALYPSGHSPRIFELIRYSGKEHFFLLANTVMLFLFGAYEVLPRNWVWGNLAKQITGKKVAFELSQ